MAVYCQAIQGRIWEWRRIHTTNKTRIFNTTHKNRKTQTSLDNCNGNAAFIELWQKNLVNSYNRYTTIYLFFVAFFRETFIADVIYLNQIFSTWTNICYTLCMHLIWKMFVKVKEILSLLLVVISVLCIILWNFILVDRKISVLLPLY